MRDLEGVAESLADSNFEVNIETFKKDEIGNMQRALISIRDSLRRAVDELSDHLSKMTVTGKRLNTVILIRLSRNPLTLWK